MKKTTEKFIQDAYCKHGDRYNYKLVDYKNNHTKVKIICHVHGIFEQRSDAHLRGQGCKKCGIKKITKDRKKTTEQFIIDAYCKHGDKYNYKLVDYKNRQTKVKIICPVHGIFEQVSSYHINGRGCPGCGNKLKNVDRILSINDFIKRSNNIHNDKYSYCLIKQNDYKNSKTKVKIICPVHGIFEQRPDNHLHGQGCPKCCHNISKQETELQNWLKVYIDIETNNRSIITPHELDIVIPEKKLCIEYNGLYWHSEQRGKDRKYHLNKYNLCKEKGYRLIQIWENEWLFKQDIVKSILLNAIGINKSIIHGRKCIIKDVSPKEARTMYNENHIQGFKGGKHKGLYYNGELVSLMTIDARNELQRFVNKKYTKVHGAFNKLLKAFLREGYKNIYTFADTRYFTGNVYEKNGFRYQYTTKPNYYYINRMNIYHRMHFQKKNIENKYNKGELEYFDPNKTEYQNMLANGYDRIWDNGNMKFVL